MNPDLALSTAKIPIGVETKEEWWIVPILMLSMIPQGLEISVFGRTPNISLFDVFLPPVILGFALRNLLGKRYVSFPDRTVLYCGLCFVFAQVVSLALNPSDPLRSVFAIKVFVFGFLVCWIVRGSVRSNRGLQLVADGLVLWGALAGVIVVYRFLTDWSGLIGLDPNDAVKNEVGISIAHSNYLAALLVPIFPVSIAGVFARRGKASMIFAVLAAIIAMAIMVTMSKGAMLALLLGAACAYPVLRRAGVKIWHVTACISAAFVLFMLLPDNLTSINVQMFTYRWENPDFNRIELWNVAWQEFLRNPILGIGPNCIYIYNRQFAVDILYTHNFILNTLAELGLSGSIPFFVTLYVILRRSYRSCLVAGESQVRRIMSIGIYVGLISTLVHGLVEPTFPGREYSVIFWVMAALVFLYDAANYPHFPKRQMKNMA